MASKVKAMNGKWIKTKSTLSDEYNHEVNRVGKYNFHVNQDEEVVLIQEDWAVIKYTDHPETIFLEHMCRDKIGAGWVWKGDNYIYCNCGAAPPENLKALIFLGN